ncbi:MAG: lysine--tRNA ligase [Anaerolineales bacterium]|nr:lysine--tRNA ligase [Anaerolineales bacterium]
MRELTDLEKNRQQKVSLLLAAGMDPYPAHAERTHTSVQARQAFEQAAEGATVAATLTGRLRSIRAMGKAVFAHIEDGEGQIQLLLKADILGKEFLDAFRNLFDLGDILQARGSLFRTRTGEITLQVEHVAMLSKAITPLPASKETVAESGERVVHSAFDNPEARYRQRYADLAVNPEVREIFRVRARMISALRRFLDSRGFLEVETPVLQAVYGGAAAKPFVTRHHQLHQDLYLRISFELYLKRLLVGGFERVYEIGRDFRNEGVSFKHNPEFTQLEFYMAYADYRQIMALTEEMISTVAREVTGTTKIDFRGHTIDLTPPWTRISLRDSILELGGIDIDAHPTAESLSSAMRVKGLSPKAETNRGKLIEGLLSHFVEPGIVQPTFLFDYPRDISPLAKGKPGQPQTVERFEGFVAGMELCNAFSELNDPLDQEQRFLEMGRAYSEEEEDRHPMDEDYLNAMRYGMPPNGGFGMGIDRLAMLLTNQPTIREVILYPHLRQREDEK